MTEEVGERDKALLSFLQNDFPLSKRPYLDIANLLGWNEDEVIYRIRNLIETGILRKVGAVIAPKKMGYASLLAAADISPDDLEEQANIISGYPGVTHNYLREGSPNLWFTMTEADQDTLDNNLDEIERRIGSKVIRMPVTKMFKIGVKLDI